MASLAHLIPNSFVVGCLLSSKHLMSDYYLVISSVFGKINQ